MENNQLPDFDKMLMLAKHQPHELERIRRNAVEDWIERAPEKHRQRLRGLQFQIDMEKRRARNPMDSCIRVSNMMHASFATLRGLLNDISGQLNAGSLNSAVDLSRTPFRHTADILPFTG